MENQSQDRNQWWKSSKERSEQEDRIKARTGESSAVDGDGNWTSGVSAGRVDAEGRGVKNQKFVNKS